MTTTDTGTTRPGVTERRPRDADATRTALIDAAVRLLPERAPSAITGRELAAEAGVNYGLLHHHFGGKEAVLHAGLVALRDDFIERFGDGADTPFLGLDSHPYLRAVVRSQVDYPESPHGEGDFPIGAALVAAIGRRLSSAGDDGAEEIAIAAKARAIAAASLQVCYGVFGAMLLDATGVGHRDRASVEEQLAALYEVLVGRTSTLDSN